MTSLRRTPVETKILSIEGMSCGHCVARVTKALTALPGVTVEDVQVGSARVRLEPTEAMLAQVASALDDVGFALKREASA